MSLTLTFWGTRGSIPTPGPSTVRYGGNTPCVELRTGDGWLIILDAGACIAVHPPFVDFWSLSIVALMVPAMLLGKWVYST